MKALFRPFLFLILGGTFLVFPIPFQLESDCKLRLGRKTVLLLLATIVVVLRTVCFCSKKRSENRQFRQASSFLAQTQNCTVQNRKSINLWESFFQKDFQIRHWHEIGINLHLDRFERKKTKKKSHFNYVQSEFLPQKPKKVEKF